MPVLALHLTRKQFILPSANCCGCQYNVNDTLRSVPRSQWELSLHRNLITWMRTPCDPISVRGKRSLRTTLWLNLHYKDRACDRHRSAGANHMQCLCSYKCDPGLTVPKTPSSCWNLIWGCFISVKPRLNVYNFPPDWELPSKDYWSIILPCPVLYFYLLWVRVAVCGCWDCDSLKKY